MPCATAAGNLPLSQHRMQYLAHFLQRDEVVDRHSVGCQIDCDFRDVDCPGEGCVGLSAILFVVPENIGGRPRSAPTRKIFPCAAT